VSVASDEARALVLDGTANSVSVGFRAVKEVRNELGGFDLDAHVFEVSLVGAPCCETCRISGSKCHESGDTRTRDGQRIVLELVPEPVFIYLDGWPMTRADVALYVARKTAELRRQRAAGPTTYQVDPAMVARVTSRVVGEEVGRRMRLAAGRLD
jgi:hypothetical protein